MAKNTWPCAGKPELLKGMPIGMYHCEYCGEMQVAGLEHIAPQFPSQWEEPFPKTLPPLLDTLQQLNAAAHARDDADVLCFLEDVLAHAAEEQADVWDALYAHRDDADASFVIAHLNMQRSDEGKWVVSIKEDTCD
jgi:hypothetical protein